MLFGKGRIAAKSKRQIPASPYPTRNPAAILAMGEQPSEMVLEGQGVPMGGKVKPEPVGGVPMPAQMPSQLPPPMPGQMPGQAQGPVPADQGPLGGSMQQPFDYKGAYRQIAGNQDGVPNWRLALAALGDGLVSHGGGRGFALQSLQQQEAAREGRLSDAGNFLANSRYDEYARQQSADLGAAAPFTIGRDRLQFNPATGQTNTLHNGQQDFEIYARQLGLQPGSPEYVEAMEDYVLRSSGPSAFDRDLRLDDHRTDNDERMEGVRFNNRQTLERMRQRNRVDLDDRRTANRASSRGGSRGSAPETDIPTFASPSSPGFAELPSGSRFRTPSGQIKIKP